MSLHIRANGPPAGVHLRGVLAPRAPVPLQVPEGAPEPSLPASGQPPVAAAAEGGRPFPALQAQLRTASAAMGTAAAAGTVLDDLASTLSQLQQLAEQAADPGLDEGGRADLEAQWQDLVEELQRLSESASRLDALGWGGGEASTGQPVVDLARVTADALGSGGWSVSSAEEALVTLQALSTALETVGAQQQAVGQVEEHLQERVDFLLSEIGAEPWSANGAPGSTEETSIPPEWAQARAALLVDPQAALALYAALDGEGVRRALE